MRKETRDLVYDKIDFALADIKGNVRDKKFAKKLQKISSLLAKDISKAAKKNASKKGKDKKGKGKKTKSEKFSKSVKISPLKMNNLPASSEVQADPNQIVP